MLVSESPDGPWQNLSGPLLVRSGGVTEPQQGLTNPAFYFFPNGSAIMAYRASLKRWPSQQSRVVRARANVSKNGITEMGEAGEGVGLAFCHNWSGPCDDLSPDLPILSAKTNCEPEDTHGSCEDMAIWPGTRGSWHMFTHDRHHYARSLSGQWRTSPTYDLKYNHVRSTDMWCGPAGGARPQLILRPDGSINYISTACKSPDGTRSRNFVRAVREAT